MTTTLTYIDALRAELRDLPEAERDELLEDVASSGDDDAALEARLGPPAEFAHELRSAAGLQARAVAPTPVATLRERVAKLSARATPLARELAPLGWVARGYLAAVAIAFIWDGSWFFNRPGLFAFHGTVWDAFWLCVWSIAASVAIGVAMRLTRRRPRAMTAVNVLFALGALLVIPKVAEQFSHRGQTRDSTPAFVQAPDLAHAGQAVTNIYAYDRNGRPLHDVRLYDEDGNPLNIGGATLPDPNRRVPHTRGGKAAYNAFPIRYYDPGTHHIAYPKRGFVRRPKPLR